MKVQQLYRNAKSRYALLSLAAAVAFFLAYSRDDTAVFSHYDSVALTKGRLSKTITARATVLPATREAVTILNPGILQDILVEEGQHIVIGQPLLLIESHFEREQYMMAKQKLLEAELQVQQAEREMERINSLKQLGQAPLDEFDKAQTSLNLLRELTEINRKLLAFQREPGTTDMIKSPASGIVLFEYPLTRGQFMHVGSRPLSIVSPDSLIVEADLNQEDARRLAIGQEITVKEFDQDASGESYRGQVVFIALEIKKGMVRVLATLPSDISFKFGTPLVVEIPVVSDVETWLVPIEAVRIVSGQAHVFVQRNERIERCKVTVGDNNHETVAIRPVDQLSEADRVIVSGFDKLVSNGD